MHTISHIQKTTSTKANSELSFSAYNLGITLVHWAALNLRCRPYGLTSKSLKSQPISRPYPETATKGMLKLAFVVPVEYH